MSDEMRGIFCNRTLNLRAIKAIGYDMDYTLIHYHMEAWERHAYSYLREGLAAAGLPVTELEFDSDLAVRGLIIDRERGNVVKADRFGYIKTAFHGTRRMEFGAQRATYARALVELREPRWHFLNTMFSISECCMYMQLVDLLDRGELPGNLGYTGLHRLVRRVLDEAHMEGRLKAEILTAPDRFVDVDPEMPLALLDQKRAGKKVLLITNSEWAYAAPMLTFSIDAFLPVEMTWRELFDISLVSARKPSCFSGNASAFEVVSDDGLLREHAGALSTGGIYVGGNARLVEESLDLEGDEILYVGDHLFVDVNVSKQVLRWRTALVLRELEEELTALNSFRARQENLDTMMAEKIVREGALSQLRLELLRVERNYGPQGDRSRRELRSAIDAARSELVELDQRIGPHASAAGKLMNPHWGMMMRAGHGKSHLARQVERYADVYTSRVSNFLYATPFTYLRSIPGNLAHEG